jgi:N6-adenosine-specific RNA methylase IME4
MSEHLPEVRRLRALGWGNRRIGAELGIGKDAAQRLLKKIELEDARSSLQILGGTDAPTNLYDTACRALAAAVRVDEVKSVLDASAAIKAYARQAKNRELEANAVVLRERGERCLGEMLIQAKKVGQIAEGRPPNGSENAPFPRVTLAEADIDKKLSARAQKKASISATAHEAMLAKMREEILSGRRSFDTLKVATTSEKQERRALRESQLADQQAASNLALPQKRYGVILADPEWRFEPWSRETGLDRAADNHYPTSVIETIAARPVRDIAAKDCALFLWATVPMLPHALSVMAAWGFDYRSHFIWGKDRSGTGYWNRNRHELLLLGISGKVPAPAMGDQWQSLLNEPVGEHSEKPERFYGLVESYFPTLPKIELNARRARPGWDAWGLDAPSQAAE